MKPKFKYANQFVVVVSVLIILCGPRANSQVVVETDNLTIDASELILMSEIEEPFIGTVGELAKATSKQNAPVFNHAILALEIMDFNAKVPPQIKVFDENVPLEPIYVISFSPFSGSTTLQTVKVEIFLAYDSTPWLRTNNKPEERTTRIEVHMPILNPENPIETVYAKFKEGIYVVPVTWHNVKEPGDYFNYKDNNKAFKLFCVPPTVSNLGYPQNASDVNSFFAQANIQFRLVDQEGSGLNRPWAWSEIQTHIVNPPDKSAASSGNCQVKWNPNYNSSKAVDIYVINNFEGLTGGFGGCFPKGQIYLVKGGESSQLVAHELGHYLGSGMEINHHYPSWHTKKGQELPFDNIMNGNAAGFQFEQWQIDKFQERIKDVITQGKTNLYNEDK